MSAYRSALRKEFTNRSSPLELLLERNDWIDAARPDLLGQLKTANALDARLRKLLELIEANPLSTIRDWAVVFNLSNSHLQRLFKRATVVALGRVLTEKRLARAATLLLHTNMSAKEIAHAIGYEHTSSFTRAFERRFEEGPRRYRQRNAA